jgi:hypothetical protein
MKTRQRSATTVANCDRRDEMKSSDWRYGGQTGCLFGSSHFLLLFSLSMKLLMEDLLLCCCGDEVVCG